MAAGPWTNRGGPIACGRSPELTRLHAGRPATLRIGAITPTRFLTRLHAGPSGLTAADGGSGQSEPGGRTITARSASGRSLAAAVSANKKPVRGGPVCGGNPRAGGRGMWNMRRKAAGRRTALAGWKSAAGATGACMGAGPEINDIPAGCSRRTPAAGCRPRKAPSARKCFRCNGIFSARASAAAARRSLSARHAKPRHLPLTASRPVTTIPHDHRDRRSDPPL